MSQKNSDAGMIEWKVFWSMLATGGSAAIGVLVQTDVLIPELATVITGVAGAGAAVASWNVVDIAAMWRDANERQRRRITQGLITAVAAFTAWTGAAVYWHDGSPGTLVLLWVALLAIGVTCYWGARGIEWRLASLKPKKKLTASAAAEANRQVSDYERVVAHVLKELKVGWLRVIGSEKLRDNAGWSFKLRKPSSAPKNAKIDDDLAESIAIKLSELSGRVLHTDWVQLIKERSAGVWTLIVLERDLLAEVIPYIDDLTPTSITEPALCGVTLTGEVRRERLDRHGRTVGSSTAGKSALIHLDLAHLTRCTDTLVWVGGIWKLYDLIAGWIEPYEGTDRKPPIDWIAYDQDGLLKMLAAAMRVAQWRMSRPMSKRRWRSLIVYVDEVSFAAQKKDVKIEFDGEWVDVSWLISAINRGAASAQVYVHLASQRGTNDQYGDFGGDIVTNTNLTRMFRSRDFLDVGRQLNNYDLPVPQHRGEYWLFDDSGEQVHLKSPYIQSADPSKPRLHNGKTVAQVAWDRRDLVQEGLTAMEGAAAAGPAYEQRAQIVTESYLMQVMAGDPNITVDPDDQDQPELDHQLEKEMAVMTDEHKPVAASKAGDMPIPNSRPERISLILRSAQRGGLESLSTAEIREYLAAMGDNVDPGTLSPTLSRMDKQGKAKAMGNGYYAAPDPANERTNTATPPLQNA